MSSSHRYRSSSVPRRLNPSACFEFPKGHLEHSGYRINDGPCISLVNASPRFHILHYQHAMDDSSEPASATNTRKLFQPIKVGDVTLAHRIVLAPLTRSRANKHGVHGDLAVEYYSQRASFPGSLLISEATYVSHKAEGRSPNVPGVWNDQQIAGWKRVSLYLLRPGDDTLRQIILVTHGTSATGGGRSSREGLIHLHAAVGSRSGSQGRLSSRAGSRLRLRRPFERSSCWSARYSKTSDGGW